MDFPRSLFEFLAKHRGRFAFVAVFLVLSVVTTSVAGLSAPSNQAATTPTTVAQHCGTYDCTPVLPSNTTPTTATADSKWGPLVSDDEFTTAAGIDGWDVYNNPQGNPKRDPSLISVSDGFANIAGSYNKNSQEGSGISQQFNQKYGRWEVRARADVGAGFSPTILLWPEDDNWPQAGEIDLLESPHGNRQNAISVVHNLTASNFKTKGIAGTQSDWHTYAVDWLPDQITFYVDDVEQWTVTDPKLIPTNSPMHLVLQNDEGCGWIQCPNASTKSVTNMQVDWIKVYAPKSS